MGTICRRDAQSRKPARDIPPSIRATLLLCLAVLGGCAVSYVDDDGTRHIIGFASIVIPPAAQTQPTAGNVIDLTTVGLSLTAMPEGQSITLGYSRAVTATLIDNALVLGNPLALKEQTHALTESSTAAVTTEVPAQVPAYDGGCPVCLVPDADGLR